MKQFEYRLGPHLVTVTQTGQTGLCHQVLGGEQVPLSIEGRVDLEHLKRMADLAVGVDAYSADARAILIMLHQLALPGWHSAACRGARLPAMHRAGADVYIVGSEAMHVLSERLVGYHDKMSRPVELDDLIWQWVDEAQVPIHLPFAQKDIVCERLVHDQRLAEHGLFTADEWVVKSVEIGLAAERHAHQIKRMLAASMTDDQAEVFQLLEEAIIDANSYCAQETFFYAGDKRRQWERLAPIRAFRAAMRRSCTLDAITICPACAQVRHWLNTTGASVLGLEVVDVSQLDRQLEEIERTCGLT